MDPIRSLDQLIADLKGRPSRRVVVAAGHDPNTIGAAARAVAEQIAEVTLVGDRDRITELCDDFEIGEDTFSVIDELDTEAAGARAVQLVRSMRASRRTDGRAHGRLHGAADDRHFPILW